MGSARRRVFATAAAWIAAATAIATAKGQGLPEVPTSPRLEFPFAVDPDRLPGPPRSMGEVPIGESQPPSTLPGFLSGPPRAMGFAPERVMPQPPFGSGISLPGGLPAGPGAFPPLAPPGRNIVLPSGSFFAPGLFRPGEPAGEGLPDALEAITAPGRIGEVAEGGRAPGIPPLTLDEVLGRSEKSYPPYLAILQERDVALGGQMSALGSFDINLNADTRNYPLGFYRRSVHDVFLDLPLRNLGGKFFSGYRVAEGKWPTYYNYLNTLGGGAFVNGIELPILKNRAIDPKRAKLYQAEIERKKVEPTILKQRITLFKDASKVYWAWVGAGRQYALFGSLVRIAGDRQRAIAEQVRQRAVKGVDLIDFERIVLSREQQLIAARRRYQQAAIELSLYARDDRGLPSLPDERRLPLRFPPAAPPDPARLREDAEVALRLRPEIFAIRLQARKARIDLDLAENQLQPSLNLYIYTEQDVGARQVALQGDFRPFIMESSLLFDVPLQRRFAKGRIVAANAEIRQIEIQAKFACDRVQADVLDAASALQAAYDSLGRYRENTARNRELLEAEATAVKEGVGTLITYNLREQGVYDALIAEVESEAKYFGALAEYRAALGLDAAGPECLALPAAEPADRTMARPPDDLPPLPARRPSPASSRSR